MIRHRNTIETWSKTDGEVFVCGNSLSYDFTDAINKAYGDNLKLKGAKYCVYSGDADQDGIVDVVDLVNIYNDASNFVSGYVPTDINGDDFIDSSDLIITYNNAINFVSLIRP